MLIRTLLVFAILLAGAPLGQLGIVAAQQPAGAVEGEKVYVAFRMENWFAKHIHDEAQATKHADTLKQLGCEVKTNAHAGHIDVQCRTVYWKSLELKSHEQASQWENWLKQSGFDTIYGQPASATKKVGPDGKHLEIVKYRLADWTSQHVHDSNQLSQLLALYRALGCDTETASHNGHTDLKKRCASWMEMELPTHDAAHKWQDFLKKAGFETQHEH